MKNIFYFLFLLLLALPAFAEDSNITTENELTGKQRIYYIRVFNYTMDNIKANESFHWDAIPNKGDIHVGEEYISKSKALCRDFTETFEINKKAEKRSGTACKRDGNNGWCKLKNTDKASTCALEEPQGITDKVINNIESTLGTGGEMLRNTKDWWGR
mgnify:FL=1